MELENELKELVSNILEIPMDDLRGEESFTECYNIDSLRALEILAAIENKYSITFDPERLQDMTCLNNVINITKDYMYAEKKIA